MAGLHYRNAGIGNHSEDKHLAVFVMECQRAIGSGGWAPTTVIQQNWPLPAQAGLQAAGRDGP